MRCHVILQLQHSRAKNSSVIKLVLDFDIQLDTLPSCGLLPPGVTIVH